MLMFDNSIFATFIPQMLMLLGYVSCVVAPFLTFSNTNTPENPQNTFVAQRIEIDEQYAVSPVVERSYHFHDYFQAESADIKSEGQIFIPHFRADSAIPQSYGNTFPTFLFTLFSRPPPYCC